MVKVKSLRGQPIKDRADDVADEKLKGVCNGQGEVREWVANGPG